MPERLEDQERRGRDPRSRRALLLARRRAGLLSDERLHLAAYLGDPAARDLWTAPEEAALMAALREPFFAGLERDIEARWQALRRERAASILGPLIEAAAAVPELRAFLPSTTATTLSFRRGTEAEAFAWISGHMVQGGSGFGAYQAYVGHCAPPPGYDRSFTEPADAARAMVDILPEGPLLVWRGHEEAYPQERIRRGAYNDALCPFDRFSALRAWGDAVLLRLAIAVELRSCEADRDHPFIAAIRAGLLGVARWLRAPSEESWDVAREALDRGPPGRAFLTYLEELRRGEGVGVEARTFLIHGLLGRLPAEECAAVARESIVPWALGDGDTLRDPEL